MYSNKTINRVISLLKKEIKLNREMIKSGEKIQLTISKGNRKIGNVLNCSLAPIITCTNCGECMRICYDLKACIQYPNTVIKARAKNTALLLENRDEYFRQIDTVMTRRRKNKYFRFHVSGDIVDIDYFSRMIETARKHPDFIVWTYTKNYPVVNEYCRRFGKETIPNNFIVMFSEWDGLTLNNPYNFPVFTCKLKKGNKNHSPEYFNNLYHCPGNCDICKKNNRGCIVGENTTCIEH